jgi:transposase
MAIVGGLDIHRRQITYDCIDTTTGESCRGQLSPATPTELRGWLEQFRSQQADFALEATTGWRFVAEELARAGCMAHLAEAGRHPGAARSQAARQDRPHRRPASP